MGLDSRPRKPRAGALLASVALAASVAFAACKQRPLTTEKAAGAEASVLREKPPGTDAGEVSPFAARPYTLLVPKGHDAAAPTPLLVLLHGYGGSADDVSAYVDGVAFANHEKILIATPDGTLDARGKRFWNATDACCDFYRSRVDDVAYIRALLDDVGSRYAVDPRRTFVVGHSNGGFMAHRLACDLSPRIAAIVSIAGATWRDASACQPTSPIAILEVHGSADSIIRVQGGSVFELPVPPYPSLAETGAMWATNEGCAGSTKAKAIDFDVGIPGAETRVESYEGCRGAVQIWTVVGGTHAPSLGRASQNAMYAFLMAHPKP